MQLQTKAGTTSSALSATARRRLAIAAAALLILIPLVWALRPGPVQVDIAPVTRGEMRVTVDEEGKTRVRQVFVVSAPITGKLRRSSLDPGDDVVANETIVAVIEPSAPPFLDVRTRQEAEAQVGAATAAVTVAQAEVRQAETELGWAQSELARSRALAQTNVVSAKAFERARLDVDKQAALLARARASLELRNAELATAKAHLIGPEAARAAAPEGPGCCVEVRSPRSGKILRELQESERVIVAGTPLFEIGNPNDIDMVVDLLSTDAVRVSPGAEATIEGAGLPDKLAAKVRLVEPAGFTKVSALGIEEQRVHTFLDFDQPAEARARLGHDYRVFARIAVWSSADALRVPLSALFRQQDAWAVYKVVGGRATVAKVDIGQRNNTFAQVTAGLAAGDSVILHPSDRVTAGTRVARRLAQ